MTTPFLLVYTDTITGCSGRILDLRASATADLAGIVSALQTMFTDEDPDAGPVTGVILHGQAFIVAAPDMRPPATCEIYGAIHTSFNKDWVLGQTDTPLTVLTDTPVHA